MPRWYDHILIIFSQPNHAVVTVVDDDLFIIDSEGHRSYGFAQLMIESGMASWRCQESKFQFSMTVSDGETVLYSLYPMCTNPKTAEFLAKQLAR